MPESSAVQPVRRLGRPRSFSDRDVFEAISAVLREEGYTALTLAAVAERVGRTPSALLRRYGDKQELLCGYLDWLARSNEEVYDAARPLFASPLDVIRVLMFLQPRQPPLGPTSLPLVDPPRYMSFIVGGRSHPAYRARIADVVRRFERRLALLIAEARDLGEIEPCDPNQLAHLLSVTFTGAVTYWFDREEGSLVDEIAFAIDAVLTPYLREQKP